MEVELELAERQLTLVKDFITAALKQSEAMFELATKDYERIQELLKRGSASLEDAEIKRAKLLDAEGRMKQLKSVAALAGK